MEIFDYRAEPASLRVVSSSAMMRPGEQSVIAYSGLPMATLLADNLVSLLLVRPHHNYINATNVSIWRQIYILIQQIKLLKL